MTVADQLAWLERRAESVNEGERYVAGEVLPLVRSLHDTLRSLVHELTLGVNLEVKKAPGQFELDRAAALIGYQNDPSVVAKEGR